MGEAPSARPTAVSPQVYLLHCAAAVLPSTAVRLSGCAYLVRHPASPTSIVVGCFLPHIDLDDFFCVVSRNGLCL